MVKIVKIVLGVILIGYFIRIIQDGLTDTMEQLNQMFWFAAAYITTDILNEIGDAVDRARSS
jgi:hypothetical protein